MTRAGGDSNAGEAARAPGAGVRLALFPGTFDPPTLGHVDLVRRAQRLFGRVSVIVAAHHDKRHLFTPEERVELFGAALAAAGVEKDSGVEVLAFDGLLVDIARRLGADAVVRGVRTAADLDYERQMALTNRALLPDLETVLLLAAPAHAHVSSTLVRQIARMGGDVRSFVPAPVALALAQRSPQDPPR